MTVYHSPITGPTTPRLVTVATRYGEELLPPVKHRADLRADPNHRSAWREQQQQRAQSEWDESHPLHPERRSYPPSSEDTERAGCDVWWMIVVAFSSGIWFGLGRWLGWW